MSQISASKCIVTRHCSTAFASCVRVIRNFAAPPAKFPELAPLLAFGAHPDDVEFGCGGVIARETRAGRKVHFVVCSRGEAGTYGTPKQRTAEAKKAAEILGATIEFLELDGDAHLEI